ncbi:MAG: threonylcarbamoyl-AMP synthase [Bacteroidetes bacterium]|nr:threonylcarbamoyl-AMP synthase [Bacteroidota bacterium]
MSSAGRDIAKAISHLNAGELVAIPTETVYGLAGNALDSTVVTKIFEAKQRPAFDPLIVHIPDPDKIQTYAVDIPQAAYDLADVFWPGPLTILLEKSQSISDLVTSGLSRVGLRCPDHELTLELLGYLSFPLAAPSANPFGYISPTTAEHVRRQLGNRVAYILDGGSCKVGIESTVVGFENEQAVIYRRGGIDRKSIARITGKTIEKIVSSNPAAPGQLTQHYAPRKPMRLGNLDELISEKGNRKVGLLLFEKSRGEQIEKILSPSGDVNEAARNLFAALRALDESEADIILAESVPEVGLGPAINDRLQRAAATSI